MNVIAIIQARMGSRRLPGKVLLPLAGRPVLWHIVNRLSHCRLLRRCVVATSLDPLDQPIVRFCEQHSVPCFRGSLEDVLDRYCRAARFFDADPVVRITADCPLIDPEVVDEVVQAFQRENYDVCGLAGEFPDGLDITVFSRAALEEACHKATLPSEREHVGPYLLKRPHRYRIGAIQKFQGLGHHRWTLDEEADYRLLSQIFERLYHPPGLFRTGDVLRLLRHHPELEKINRAIERNAGYRRSLLRDRQGALWGGKQP